MNVDEAFTRRLDAVVDSPPDADAQALYVGTCGRTSCGRDLDLTFMADVLEVSGGSIRNICVALRSSRGRRRD